MIPGGVWLGELGEMESRGEACGSGGAGGAGYGDDEEDACRGGCDREVGADCDADDDGGSGAVAPGTAAFLLIDDILSLYASFSLPMSPSWPSCFAFSSRSAR